MSKNRKLGWRAFEVLLLIAVCLYAIWQTDISNDPKMGVIFWILALGLSAASMRLIIIAVAGWCNYDIFKLLARKRRRKKRPPPDKPRI